MKKHKLDVQLVFPEVPDEKDECVNRFFSEPFETRVRCMSQKKVSFEFGEG